MMQPSANIKDRPHAALCCHINSTSSMLLLQAPTIQHGSSRRVQKGRYPRFSDCTQSLYFHAPQAFPHKLLLGFTFADLSAENCQDFEFDSSTWLSSTLNSQKEKTDNPKRECREKCNMVPISEEELKIRSELGMEIENELEKEIKEGIYHLALGLHRIYQERKERSAKETFELDNKRARALTELNISIRMEGRTKVEIREVNNVKKGGSYQRNSWPKNVKEVKKIDWVKTLRGGSSPVCGSRLSNVSSKPKGKKLSTDPNGLSNWKIHSGRGKKAGSFGQLKQNASVNKKILQLGWKV